MLGQRREPDQVREQHRHQPPLGDSSPRRPPTAGAAAAGRAPRRTRRRTGLPASTGSPHAGHDCCDRRSAVDAEPLAGRRLRATRAAGRHRVALSAGSSCSDLGTERLCAASAMASRAAARRSAIASAFSGAASSSRPAAYRTSACSSQYLAEHERRLDRTQLAGRRCKPLVGRARDRRAAAPAARRSRAAPARSSGERSAGDTSATDWISRSTVAWSSSASAALAGLDVGLSPILVGDVGSAGSAIGSAASSASRWSPAALSAIARATDAVGPYSMFAAPLGGDGERERALQRLAVASCRLDAGQQRQVGHARQAGRGVEARPASARASSQSTQAHVCGGDHHAEQLLPAAVSAGLRELQTGLGQVARVLEAIALERPVGEVVVAAQSARRSGHAQAKS